MTRRIAPLWLAVALVTTRLPAQAPITPEHRPTAVVRYGKWGAAALAIALTAAGAVTHEQANQDYDQLTGFCRDVGPCTIGPDGRYVDPTAEGLYQEVVQGDRAARAWLIAGEVALAGAVTLFVIELRQKKGSPNIPYSPFIVAPGPRGIRLGLRLATRL